MFFCRVISIGVLLLVDPTQQNLDGIHMSNCLPKKRIFYHDLLF